MRINFQRVVRLFNRVQRRLEQGRPGSVLILTVVMVVLLALLGTALLTTTRNDRYVATQNTANTQIDMLVDGVKTIVREAIRDDLFGTDNGGKSVFRPPVELTNAGTQNLSTYDNFDGPFLLRDDPTTGGVPTDVQNDCWLSPTAPYYAPATGVMWLGVGTSLTGNGFDSPMALPTYNGIPSIGLSTTYAQRIQMHPAFVKPAGYTQTYPAWLIQTAPGPRFVLAGDADGDGIADSNLIKLPIGEIDGITYYYCYRIVDNASRVNVNTAWSSAYDFDFGTALGPADALGAPVGAGSFASNLGVFRSHVGLFEMMRRSTLPAPLTPANWNDSYTWSEMNLLNRYRYSYSAPAGSFAASSDMVADPNALRGDGSFITQGDVLEHQLSLRLANPGIVHLSSGGTPQQMQVFAMNDAASLAYHGGLLNPDASMTALEQGFFNAAGAATLTLADSLVRSTPNYKPPSGTLGGSISGQRAYPSDKVADWFNEFYNWSGFTGNVMVGSLNLGALGPNSPTFFRTIRPLVTTWNPVSNQIPIRYLSSVNNTYSLPGGMNPYGRMTGTGPLSTPNFHHTPAKVNANTAKFEDLYRAYWCIMSGNTEGGTGTPFETAFNVTANADIWAGMEFETSDPILTPSIGQAHPQRMFRTPLRDPRSTGTEAVYMENGVVAMLRSAIAAVNTIALRDTARGTATPPITVSNPAYRPIGLPIKVNGTDEVAIVTIYRPDPQPFITEVYAQTDVDTKGPAGGANPIGYVAIELYNPYPFEIPLDTAAAPLRIAKITRPQGMAQYPLVMTEIANLAGVTNARIPARGYLLLENYDPNNVGVDNSALFRPASSGLQQTGIIPGPQAGQPDRKVVPVTKLHEVLDGEMVLMLGGTAVTDVASRPLDSYDFSGIPPGAQGGVAWVLHYARSTMPWQFVYPGRYSALNFQRRQQGTQLVLITLQPDGTREDPWDVNAGSPPTPGMTFGQLLGSQAASNENPVATYTNTFPIQLMNVDSAGPNPLLTATGPAPNPKLFPFGGFGRNGDLLQVPFIGTYRVTQATGGGLLEINSISMDSAFAEDSIVDDDPPPSTTADDGTLQREQVGRFCPIPERTGGTNTVNDYSTDPAQHSYAWARKLFDYLTVQAPGDDYMLDVSPDRYQEAGGTPEPVPVDSDADPSTPGGESTTVENAEDVVPLHGLININTAPWPVLAAIPFVPRGLDETGFTPANGANGKGAWTAAGTGNTIEDNIELAQAIVAWRDGDPARSVPAHGPFKSIFDLYSVPAFAELQRRIYLDTASPEASSKDGDFTPGTGGVGPITPGTTDGVRRDFEEYFLMLNRVSNLITTRSDSFTVYLQVQGWRGVGTPKPELVVQRRVAFIQDRYQVSDTNSQLPAPVNVPND